MINAKKHIINKFDKVLSSCRVVFLYSLIIGFIANILILSVPIYSMQVFDRVISSHSIETLVMLTLITTVILAFLNGIQGLRSIIYIKMGIWFEKELSPFILSNSLKLSVAQNNFSGSQILRELNTLKNFISSNSMVTILDTPWAIIFLIVLFMIHPILGLTCIVGGIILLSLAYLNETLTKKSIESSNELYNKSMQQIDQMIKNAEVIESMAMFDNLNEHIRQNSRTISDLQASSNARNVIILEITKFVRLVLQISITGLGAYLVLNNSISSGAIIASSALVGRALAPFESAIGTWKQIITARKSFDKLSELFNIIPEKPETIKLPSPKGEIKVENIYYAPFGSNKPIIKNISFYLEPGCILAIIGPSASCKSTLAKLVCGILTPSSGAIRFDGAELKNWNKQDLGSYIGYIPQDVELFSGSIKLNIARMDINAQDEDIVKAAKIAGIHEMILRLPQGYETEIGQFGATLSSGQKQRIALARAFYGNPRLLVLDEPNSNLDSEGDIALTKALLIAKQMAITTIIVSHRTNITQVVDKLMVMQDGMITMFGPKDDVVNKLKANNAPAA